jgi:uncharacterized protein YprB with RNaseH-like and TPR domain
VAIEELRERLRRLTGRALVTARELPPPPPRSPDLPLRLEGEIVQVDGVSVLRRERHYPEDHHHGSIKIGTSLDLDPALLAALAGSTTQTHAGQIAFLDTETTGLSGSGWCAFLVGIGEISRTGLTITQYMIRDLCEEQAMLSLVHQHLQRFPVLVTYNGRAFDWPLISSRSRFHGIQAIDPALHIDLLFVARRLWRRMLGGARLIQLEEGVLNFHRVSDMPSSLIPEAFFRFVADGDEAPMVEVMEHNALDILSLAVMSGVTARTLTAVGPVVHGADPLALAKLAESRGNLAQAAEIYRHAIQAGLGRDEARELLPRLARLYRRSANPQGAVWAWKELLERTQGMYLSAYEELARLHERSLGDTHQARVWCEDGLKVLSRGLASMGKRPALLQKRLRARVARLTRPKRPRRPKVAPEVTPQ